MAKFRFVLALALSAAATRAEGVPPPPITDFPSLSLAVSMFTPQDQGCLALAPGISKIHFSAAIQISSDVCIDFTGATLVSDGAAHRAFTVNSGSLRLYGGIFQDFHADNGGVLQFGPGSVGEIQGSQFSSNQASGLGGAIDFRGVQIRIDRAHFSDNSAGVFGCDINIDTPPGASPSVIISNSLFTGPNCGAVRIEQPLGWMASLANLYESGATAPDLIHSTGRTEMWDTLFGTTLRFELPKMACRDFGSGAFRSFGGNWSFDSSCMLTHPADITVPIVLGPLVGGVPSLPAGSPAIDSGKANLIDLAGGPTLPCGPADARGLGRPQDADGDGLFECDSGAFEVQGGPDIGAAQGATYFDVARNGEGSVVELFGDGSAVIATFTYRPDARGLAWLLGVGRRVGNSIVVEQMLRPRGGAFGAAFNAANIRNPVVGAASMVFPNCDASARPGKFMFRANRAGGFQDLMVDSTRITAVVPCAGNAHAQAYRSGSYYDPTRSGEGIFVEVLTDGRVTLIWYTFDPQGNQLWLVSNGQAQVQGNRYTIEMLYPAQATRFGTHFNPAEIVLQPWGTVVLEFTGCNTAQFSYNASAAGYGSGSYNYVRLTQPNGTSCP